MIRDLKNYDKMISFVRQLQLDPKKELGIVGWASNFEIFIDGEKVLPKDGILHHFIINANTP
jgi:hypothetical protein